MLELKILNLLKSSSNQSRFKITFQAITQSQMKLITESQAQRPVTTKLTRLTKSSSSQFRRKNLQSARLTTSKRKAKRAKIRSSTLRKSLTKISNRKKKLCHLSLIKFKLPNRSKPFQLTLLKKCVNLKMSAKFQSKSHRSNKRRKINQTAINLIFLRVSFCISLFRLKIRVQANFLLLLMIILLILSLRNKRKM